MGFFCPCCQEAKPDIQAKRSMDEEFFKLHVDAGHMNERRRSFITRLYSTLGNAKTLDATEMAAAFDSDAHPDVVAGNRTAKDVRAELLEALSMDGGPVTRQLFEDYYDIQSITIELDEQFEALVRSSWIGLVRQKAQEKMRAKKEAAAKAAENAGVEMARQDGPAIRRARASSNLRHGGRGIPPRSELDALARARTRMRAQGPQEEATRGLGVKSRARQGVSAKSRRPRGVAAAASGRRLGRRPASGCALMATPNAASGNAAALGTPESKSDAASAPLLDEDETVADLDQVAAEIAAESSFEHSSPATTSPVVSSSPSSPAASSPAAAPEEWDAARAKEDAAKKRAKEDARRAAALADVKEKTRRVRDTMSEMGATERQRYFEALAQEEARKKAKEEARERPPKADEKLTPGRAALLSICDSERRRALRPRLALAERLDHGMVTLVVESPPDVAEEEIMVMLCTKNERVVVAVFHETLDFDEEDEEIHTAMRQLVEQTRELWTPDVDRAAFTETVDQLCSRIMGLNKPPESPRYCPVADKPFKRRPTPHSQ
ncbi:hypothetical protein JL722_9241 [Aureococcus anophagefferens]|nr:hypothetical protein JL722_9241 [Aureococcus anophagefferens]